MLFSKRSGKETSPSTLLTSFSERLDKVEQTLAQLKNENLDLYTTIDTLRNKVLRKIQSRRDSKEEDDTSLYNGLEAGAPVPNIVSWGKR